MTQARATPPLIGALPEQASHRDQVGAEQVAALFRLAPLGVSAAAIGALILAVTLYRLGHVEAPTGGAWVTYIVACAAAHIMLGDFYKWAKPAVRDWRRWAWAFTAISFAEGIGWGWATLWLATAGSFELDLRPVRCPTTPTAFSAAASPCSPSSPPSRR